MKTLIIAPVGQKAGLVYSDLQYDVFSPHAAHPEFVKNLTGRRYDAMIVLPYANVGQSTDSQIKQLATQVRPSGEPFAVSMIGFVDVNQGA